MTPRTCSPSVVRQRLCRPRLLLPGLVSLAACPVDARCLPQPRGRPHSGGVIVVAIVAVLLAVVLVADRVAVIRAEHRVARRIGDRGFSAEPHVIIAGFPFLTQLAARRLNKVVIRAEGTKLGPLEVK